MHMRAVAFVTVVSNDNAWWHGFVFSLRSAAILNDVFAYYQTLSSVVAAFAKYLFMNK